MKYCVSGSSGQLGDAMRHMIGSGGHDFVGIDVDSAGIDLAVDVTNTNQMESFFEKTTFDWFIHAAAYTNVDACEENKLLAEKVNAESVDIIAKLCAQHNRKLCLISTDYVFDGEIGNYSEDAPTNPLQHYGLTKLRGEDKLIRTGIEHIILRTSVLWSKTKHNFVTWVKTELSNGKTIKLAEDQIVCPTSTETLGNMILSLTSQNRFGLFNATGSTPHSRFEMGKIIQRKFDLGGEIIPCSIRDFDFAAARPQNSSLDVSKISQYVRSVSFEESLDVF